MKTNVSIHSHKPAEEVIRLKLIIQLKNKIDELTNSLNAGNFETNYREISILQLRLDRIQKYKDYTCSRQMNWNIRAAATCIVFILFMLPLFSYSQVSGEYVGKVSATDPDAGTFLTFTIIQGNRDSAFCFGYPWQFGPDHTGIIRVNKPEIVKQYKTFILVVKIQDNGIPEAPFPQYYIRARVRIRYPDKFIVESLSGFGIVMMQLRGFIGI